MAHSIHFIETISLSPYRIPYNSWITSAQHLNRLSYYLRALILLLTTTGDTCWYQSAYFHQVAK